jgi:predicted nucleic acid-binding protein
MKYLLDTNVVSEAQKHNCNKNVIALLSSIDQKDQYISTITIGEIAFGIEKLPVGKKKTDLFLWFDKEIPKFFNHRIIPVSADIMLVWARLCAEHGKTLPIFDSILAATALNESMILVTRNVEHFKVITGLGIINPWEYH